ncbi:class I SAM-dependent methyltransferase [Coprothermobacteraceae bacterium]|nr:class I SAM-dependent methyltransferase [Coprothermobacteraceae bacterium]
MVSVSFLLWLNKLFPKPLHPFNLEDANVKTFAQWEFEQSEKLVRLYAPEIDLLSELRGTTLLDIGAGAGGKTTWYALHGTAKAVGVDIEEGFVERALRFASSKGVLNVEFRVENAEQLSFPDGVFDIVVMNDVFEHLSDPPRVLAEAYRVLKSGGKVFINSPPYFHPYGAHLSDLIGIPWVHVLFEEKTLVRAYKLLAQSTPSGAMRLKLRLGDQNGGECISYINKMTIAKFERIIKEQNPFHTVLWKLIPLRPALRPLTRTPLREFATKMIVYVGQKD